MSARLVGEVTEWLRSPAASGLTVAERAVLLVIAERASEETREMWRHRSDDVTLFERICEITGLDKSGLTKTLKRLSGRELEVRIPMKHGKDGRPIYAYKGLAMRFRLPGLPASVALPQRIDESPPFDPVDNPPGAPPDGSQRVDEREGFSAKGSPGGSQRVDERGPLSLSPSTDSPSTSSYTSPYGAEEEDSHAADATNEQTITGQQMGWNPEYTEARDYLQILPDFGGEFMDQARQDLGADAPVAERVIYAARLAAKGIPA